MLESMTHHNSPLIYFIQEGAVAIPRASSVDHIKANANFLSEDGLPKAILDEGDILEIKRLEGILGSLWD